MGASRALVAYDVCGCTAAITVLTGYEASAYADAADWAKRGHRIEEVDTAEWKARGAWHCGEHPSGPPWWKSNGGNGKAPSEYAPQQGLGL